VLAFLTLSFRLAPRRLDLPQPNHSAHFPQWLHLQQSGPSAALAGHRVRFPPRLRLLISPPPVSFSSSDLPSHSAVLNVSSDLPLAGPGAVRLELEDSPLQDLSPALGIAMELIGRLSVSLK
jgi:hypothetical protein